MCKHVRKRPPEVELTGLGCWEIRTGDLQYDYSSCWDEGAGEGEGVGSPSREQVELPADHSLGCSSVDRAPDILTSIPSFSKSRSVDSRLTLKLSVFLSLLQAPHNYTSLPSCVFPSSFSATVINSNTPSLKCQSKLHRDLRRTIVCLYAQSINLNYQLSHYMPTIKQ